MAKRKRLSPAMVAPEAALDSPLETKSARPPIAQVAGAAAEQAGLAEVARALTEAREEGRLIQKLPLEKIATGHLVRDRIAFDEAEMAALRDSLRARGQQVPIEVVAQGTGGYYGLISGLRRVMALESLGARYVLAIVRQPESSAEAYLAMVEENEIRAGISFYERARLAAEATKLGLYPSNQAAIAALFGSASPAKRSKIGSFVRVYEAFCGVLRFPAAIPERLGLALAGALEEAGFADRLSTALEAADPATAEAERAVLERALQPVKTGSDAANRAEPEDTVPGIRLKPGKGRLVLSGPGVTPQLQAELEAWLAARKA